MKSGRLRIVTTLLTAASLVAVYFAAEFLHQTRSSALARDLVADASRVLLQEADPAALLALLEDPAAAALPDLEALQRFGDLLAMDQPSGEIVVPPLFSGAEGTASFSFRAHYAYGTADVNAQLGYRDGAWALLRYELIPGPGVM